MLNANDKNLQTLANQCGLDIELLGSPNSDRNEAKGPCSGMSKLQLTGLMRKRFSED